ncbi:MAG TPA: AarF/ABC1/UbiB kinase family protein [Bdellovibrionales bacterium]|nr:AarF/ABC1/UbiB kinase family protein [Bdellovibrionales bacterium]
MSERKTLKKIRSGLMDRGWGLAKTALSVGASTAGHWVGRAFESDKNILDDRLKSLIISQATALANQMHEMKGSVMKMGQMFSVYGEYFLPPEANEVLKSLQSQSLSLEWPVVEKILARELGPKLHDLEIERTPIAAASMSQVHKAFCKPLDREVAVKVRYPGVEKAIDGDIRMLKTALSFSKLVPQMESLGPVFSEIREMLHRETSFNLEREALTKFKAQFAPDSRFILPDPIPEYSTDAVLCTGFEEGVRIDDPRVLALPLETRNELGRTFLELYFIELFDFRQVQTDPHFGNFAINLDGQKPRIVLFDFGAVREFSDEFVSGYRQVLRGLIDDDSREFRLGCERTGMFRKPLTEEQWAYFQRFCQEILEPFLNFGPRPFQDEQGRYDWSASDLPSRLLSRFLEFKRVFRNHAPPREFIFLDRKASGLFVVLAKLGTCFDARPIMAKYIEEPAPRPENHAR